MGRRPTASDLRIGFPTCWCSTSQLPELLAEAGWTIRGDALVERAHRETRDHLARLTVEDWKWWTVSARERLAFRLGVVGATTDADGPLRQTARSARQMREAMLARPLPTERP